MSEPRTCWVISDGRRGIENQALGLAEAMASSRRLNIETNIIKTSWLFSKLPAWTQYSLRKKPSGYFLADDYPDIAIGCGRQAIAPLLALKNARRKHIFTAYVQNPRLATSYFDVVIAPLHDDLSGPNVISMIGSPNRITPERLAADKDLIQKPVAKTAAWLIGGPSGTHSLSRETHSQHKEILSDLLNKGWHVFITTSRRTPIDVIQDYQAFSARSDNITLYTGEGENPYFAFLYHADAIFVTEESTNMLVEACATGKPLFRLPMAGKPRKFDKLYDALAERCHVTRYDNNTPLKSYEPLNETARIAEKLWTEFDNHIAGLA